MFCFLQNQHRPFWYSMKEPPHIMLKTQTGYLCVISKTNLALSCVSLLSLKRMHKDCVCEPPFEVRSPKRDKKASVLNQHLQSICIAQLSQGARCCVQLRGPYSTSEMHGKAFCPSLRRDHKRSSLCSRQWRSEPVLISD